MTHMADRVLDRAMKAVQLVNPESPAAEKEGPKNPVRLGDIQASFSEGFADTGELGRFIEQGVQEQVVTPPDAGAVPDLLGGASPLEALIQGDIQNG